MQIPGPRPTPSESAALGVRPCNPHCQPAPLAILMHKCIWKQLAAEQKIMLSFYAGEGDRLVLCLSLAPLLCCP